MSYNCTIVLVQHLILVYQLQLYYCTSTTFNLSKKKLKDGGNEMCNCCLTALDSAFSTDEEYLVAANKYTRK